MKRFLKKIFYFSLPIFIVSIFIEILIRNIPNDYVLKKEYLDKHSHQIETLILGTSHSFYGLNPDYFYSNTFNASHVSQSLKYDFEILKKFQDDFINLKTLILPISYFSLYFKLEASGESWRIKNYIIYYDMDKSESFTDYSEVLGNRLDVNIKRLVLYYLLGRSNITSTQLGWGADYHSENALDLVETGIKAAQIHTRDDINSEKNQNQFKENLLILDSILSWCKERDVRLLLITLPVFDTYRDNLNPEQWNSTFETTSKLASKCDNAVYINLIDDPNYTTDDFYNADHLSEIGAEKLSRHINSQIHEWK